MKKLVLISLILLAIASINDAFGQYTYTDVYSAGNYLKSNGCYSARIFKGSEQVFVMSDNTYDHSADALVERAEQKPPGRLEGVGKGEDSQGGTDQCLKH